MVYYFRAYKRDQPIQVYRVDTDDEFYLELVDQYLDEGYSLAKLTPKEYWNYSRRVSPHIECFNITNKELEFEEK